MKSQNLHRWLPCDIKRLCLHRKRDFRITSYSERFQFFGEILILKIWMILDPNLTFTTIYPNFSLLQELQPNRPSDPSSNTQVFQTRVQSQNLPRWLTRDIKLLCSHPGGFWNHLTFWNIWVFLEIFFFLIWRILHPYLNFTPIFPNFLLLPVMQPNRCPDRSSNTQHFQTRVKSQNLPRWLPCDIKRLRLHRKRDFRTTSYSERF